jgi:hypothetical protein
MRAIFLKELRDGRGLVLLLVAITIALQALPRSLCQTWTGFSVFLAIPMLCCYLGARLLTSETEDEQLSLLLTIPLPRWKLFAAKIGAGLAMTAVIALVAACGTAGQAGFRWSDKQVGFWSGSVLLLYTLGAFFSLTMAKSQGASFAAFLAFVIGATGFDSYERQLSERIGWEGMVVALYVSTALTMWATGWAFCRADLTDMRDRRKYALSAGLTVVALALGLAYYLSRR